ncbi:MAG TPA: hypothetical protein VHP58_02920 [Alphaproteobacteria bacterium]|nr:hypothetical protein [Alphaproteobacteria bacterium]
MALFFGLLLTLFGLYQMLVARNTTLGVIMICVGLCIPYTQNIMGGLQSAFCPTITTLGGQCAGFSMGTTGVGGIGSK